jgi:soluble lytic murein transglycosylase-like protein
LLVRSRRRSALYTSLLALSVAGQVLTAARAHESLTESRSSTCNSAWPFVEFTTEASRRFNLPERTIRAVMQVESDCDARAVSPKGAIGLMQIMPTTWQEVRRRYALGNDPFDPHDNILAGTAYLREMRDRFGVGGFLAAYNAGPERYEEYLTAGRALPDETTLYLTKLDPTVGAIAPARVPTRVTSASVAAKAPLFVSHVPTHATAEPASPGGQSAGSSAPPRSLWDIQGVGLFVPGTAPGAGQ